MPESELSTELVEPVEDEIEDETRAISIESKLYSYPADFTLEVLHQKLEQGEIEVPPFQRKYVWSKEGASMLIDSFMRSLPVPPVYLFTTPEKTLWIIDGHQRLISVSRFLANRWEDEEPFKLSLSDDNELNGLDYGDFASADQRKLKNSVLRAVIIEPREGNAEDALYDMFERLNTGGVSLKPQEIRNCVYRGTFNDKLAYLNKNVGEWRRILGTDEEDKRLRDVELILRGVALSHLGTTVRGDGVLAYKPSLKSFLNEFMKSNRNPGEQWLGSVSDTFARTTQAIVANLPEKPFHLRRSMNAATYDAVFVAFARHLDSVPSDIRRRYDRLKADNNFRAYTEERPTGEQSVNGRIEIAERLLFGR